MTTPQDSGPGHSAPKRGRPVKEIDLAVLNGLAAICATRQEIAVVLGISERTLTRRNYDALIRKGAARGRISLRRWQMRAARRGNPTLLVWLGKQHLGQSDHAKVEHAGVVEQVWMIGGREIRF